jgi:hypothetical protein
MTEMVKIDAVEQALAMGNIAQLGPQERMEFLARLNESVGTNPLTSPFQFLTLQGRTVIYATKGATDQLRKIHHVSIEIVEKVIEDGMVMVTARATSGERVDEDVSVVFGNPRKDPNLIMKAVTKAKRRVTLSICGLGLLDESEIETIPGAQRVPAPAPRALPKPKADIGKMVAAFGQHGIGEDHLLTFVGKETMEDIDAEDVAKLRQVYGRIAQGMDAFEALGVSEHGEVVEAEPAGEFMMGDDDDDDA